MIFVFPGQGSQFVGMGKEIYDNFTAARNVFHEVNDILGKDLTKIIFEGPSEDLMSTENAQLALMAVSIATLRALESVLGKKFCSSDKVKYMAGHSVGEYTALCASGAISLPFMVQLLKVRSKAMHEAVAYGYGGMVALIGGSIDEVESVVHSAKAYGICEIANDNCNGQVVVSGVRSALENLEHLVKGTNIRKIIKLQVSGPFHSSLMYSAYKEVSNFIDCIDIKMPAINVVSNVSASEYTNCSMIKDLLARQIISRVRWRESVIYMIRRGYSHFVEIGAGNVLSNLVQRIDNTVCSVSVSTVKCIDAVVSSYFSVVDA
ncbi:ACP S-malonyltransferase [Neoehrlichia mikurensis]|uniref:Malonyl CoA-acyl carrier protein transacylase n=1 Tax=Neoehrlichia mikurensis TaxID=89586 RepID=A0A9Q9F3V3_9RICK|nr:ACP S-malonyltransferase [Neoehrlichia mikurensis]QXK91680.1 ACP S-malonyltransferase [Neoehrlichia mikurensis]QXK92891.1 ACP S-malonyltransferase [Neoehrlichia mikurensis]QXK93371.1 ACP S-malonyltransferase [Neoehrlichia mikurensis]UTO55684.1 ACP S-malonyltransferase [Neoehrlichia mikurensis]UTO56602.1 ACP S-malonyltransferase [Neoehrlichia mikurensis]